MLSRQASSVSLLVLLSCWQATSGLQMIPFTSVSRTLSRPRPNSLIMHGGHSHSHNNMNSFQRLAGSANDFKRAILKPFTKQARQENKNQSNASKKESRAVDRVTFIGVSLNTLLSAMKLVAGLKCHSKALIADAVHSISDLLSDFVTLWSVRISRLPADEDFPFGHGKFEAVGSLFLSFLLLGAGIGIGSASLSSLVRCFTKGVGAGALLIPTTASLMVAFFSIVSKEWLYRITKKLGEKIRSPVVIANAWHHRTDAYSSILALGSIVLSMAFPRLLFVDSFAGLLVALAISGTGAEILVEAVKQLTDMADVEVTEGVTHTLEHELHENKNIINVGRVRARRAGSSSLVDAMVTFSDGLSLSATRAIEEHLISEIMHKNPHVIGAEIHSATDTMNPHFISQPDSLAELQDDVKHTLLRHPYVNSVSQLALHHSEENDIEVHAIIRVNTISGYGLTISQAEDVIQGLSERIKTKYEAISEVKVFIDVNQSENSRKMENYIMSNFNSNFNMNNLYDSYIVDNSHYKDLIHTSYNRTLL